MARYDIEANKKVAQWKQRMIMMKPLVYAAMIEEEASKHGIDLGCLAGGDINVIANMPCMRTESIDRRCVEFEQRLILVEKLVHAKFLLEAAAKDNVDISRIGLDPVMVYKKCVYVGRNDKEVQVDFGCMNCDSFVEDADDWGIEVCII